MQSTVGAPAYRRWNSVLVTRLLALVAILWAGAWLLLVLCPGGELVAVDRGYDLMVMPFEPEPRDGGSVMRRLVEFVCLLPAAFFLVMAQAVQKQRLGRGGPGRTASPESRAEPPHR